MARDFLAYWEPKTVDAALDGSGHDNHAANIPKGIWDSEWLSLIILVFQSASVLRCAYPHVWASSTQMLSELGIKSTRARAAHKKSK
jgi:hypothetical protein